ncbi:MAG: ATP-dependent Clp protease ATP-binding subunit ClpC [Actinomycetota bacterium]|nr:ATP-dependent Clp protease ATP-binding subunit ClpC [Actinomycetota bacterium]
MRLDAGGATVAVMFERFTDRARRVVVLAQEEARLLHHNYIGTEHILLGLVHDGDGVAGKALEQLGISLVAVRSQVEKIIGQGGSSPSGHIPFTPRARKVLQLSQREALQLGHNYIGTEHLLLGLIREGQGVAAQVLVRLGADLSRVRQQVIQLLSGYTGGAGPAAPVGPVGVTNVAAGGAAIWTDDEHPIGETGRRVHIRVKFPAETSPWSDGGRIALTVDDPVGHRPPELELVVKVRDTPPSGSRAIYATARDVVRHLDTRLAELASDDQEPPAPEPGTP